MAVFLYVLGGFPQNVMIRFASYFEVTSWIDIAAFQNFRHEGISLSRFHIWGRNTISVGAFRRRIYATNRISARLYKREQYALPPESRIWCWRGRPSRTAFHSELNDEGESSFGCEKISTCCRSAGWSWNLAYIPSTCENL